MMRETTIRLPWMDRLAAFVGAWALRRVYGCCAPTDYEPECRSCQAGKLVREMEDIARGR